MFEKPKQVLLNYSTPSHYYLIGPIPVMVDVGCGSSPFSNLFLCHRLIKVELLGGNFKSKIAKLFFPLIALHFAVCLILTPMAILLDGLDKKKLSASGYAVLCEKSA
jgi:hypothetical protein